MKFLITLISICFMACALSAQETESGAASSGASKDSSSTSGNTEPASPGTSKVSSSTSGITEPGNTEKSSSTTITAATTICSTLTTSPGTSKVTSSTSVSTKPASSGTSKVSSSTSGNTEPVSSPSPSPRESSSNGTTVNHDETTPHGVSSPSPSPRESSSGVTTITDEGTTSHGVSSASPSTGVSSSTVTTVDDQETSSHGDTTNDTIITYSTPLDGRSSTNGTDSTTTYKTTTIITTTVKENKDASLCLNNPCKNGGTCKEIQSAPNIICECTPGYVGIRCGMVDKCIYDSDGKSCKNGYCAYTKDGQETFCDCFLGNYWDKNNNECREITSLCSMNPCENGGECHLLPDKYNCSCKVGFSGKTCEITDRCVTNKDCGPGVCILSDDKKTRLCKCDEGYYSPDEPHTCKAIKTPCDLKPCKNGGVCNDFKDKTYNCTCKTGFSGNACEIVNLCASKEDCGNGDCTLSEDKMTMSCKCSEGFYLVKESHTCKKISNACQPNPCMYDGICTVLPANDFNCTCSMGFTGKKCEVWDLCVTNGGNIYCGDGTCQNNYQLGNFYCTCPPDHYFKYTERKCVESNASLCFNNPCKNGGTCKEILSAPNITCGCTPGYVGIRCGMVDKCIYDSDRKSCKNGYCAYTKDGQETFCDCFPGNYWDKNNNECREITSVCSMNPCENGGECHLLPDKYNCSCKVGFSGKTCEITDLCVTNKDCGPGVCILSDDKKTRLCKCDEGYYSQDETHTCKAKKTPCDLKPCKNGGVCNDLKDKTYNCTCKTGFSGKACEIVDLCASKEDCVNGDCTLSEDKMTMSCKCSEGFYLESHTCKKISNACQPNPCMYDGICTVLPGNDFNCTCSMGFTGKKCEVWDLCVTNGGNIYCGDGTCQNNYQLGNFYCTCPPDHYFKYTERKCVEADLCPLMQCESTETCLNKACICKENYKNSTGKCEPDFCSKKPCPAPGMLCEEGTGATDYKCTCKKGYSFNGTHCNVVLCIFPQLNSCQQRCSVSDNGYKCSCDENFTLRNDNTTCELKNNSNTCKVKVCDKGSCALKSSGEVCICPPGYIEVDTNCTDLCTAGKIPAGICPDGCELTTEGGFRCKCKGKFTYAEDKSTCVVRNMCQENEAGWKTCSEINAGCLQNWNKTEGFECRCKNGQVKTEDGICRDVCAIESNQKMCSLKGGICDDDKKGNATCKCPPYFQLSEKDGKCNKPADASYLVTLPLDLSTYTMANRKRRSLDTSVDYRKISRDVKITIEEMFVGYKRSTVLYCNPASDYILCKIELQFDTEDELQLKRLRTEDICLGEEDAKKCLLPPALVLVKERISKDVIIEPTDPCEDYIKEEMCGSETTCASFLTSKSFNCTCKPGFVMRKRDFSFDGRSVIESCRDIDECLQNPCMENSICKNTFGSYDCTCKAGFRKELSSSNEVKCVEICSPNPCTHGLCSTSGDHEFDCKCDAGYTGALCDLHDENFKSTIKYKCVGKADKGERNNSIILGVVLGGILLITIILFAVYISRLRKRKCMDNLNVYNSTEMQNLGGHAYGMHRLITQSSPNVSVGGVLEFQQPKERGRINNSFQRE